MTTQTGKKSFREFADHARSILNLVEKKNRSKRGTRNPSITSTDSRSKKIRDLKNNDSLWSGLE